MTDRLPVVLGAGNVGSELQSGDSLLVKGDIKARVGGSATGTIQTRDVGATGGGDLIGRHVYAGGSAGGFHVQDNSGGSAFNALTVIQDGSPASNVLIKVNGDTITAAGWEISSGNISLMQGWFLTNAITPTAFNLTGTTNDWAPTGFATCSRIRAATSLAAVRTISGLAGGADGRVVTITNVAATSITGWIVLSLENAGSSAANRFAIGSDIKLLPGDSVTLCYDGTSSRWRRWGNVAPITAATPTSLQAAIMSYSPRAYWRCNESSGTTLADSSGNGFDLTLSGGSYTLAFATLYPTSDETFINFSGVAITGVAARSGSVSSSVPLNFSHTLFCAIRGGNISGATARILFEIGGAGETEAANVQTELEVISRIFTSLWERSTGTDVSTGLNALLTEMVGFTIGMVKDSSAKTLSFYMNGCLISVASYAFEPTGGTSVTTMLGNVSGSNNGIGATMGEFAYIESALAASDMAYLAKCAGLYGQ